jgi:hypothetical protein
MNTTQLAAGLVKPLIAVFHQGLKEIEVWYIILG